MRVKLHKSKTNSDWTECGVLNAAHATKQWAKVTCVRCNKRRNKFVHRINSVKKTAKEWGYKSKREVAIFTNGYVKGCADILREYGLVEERP